MSQKKDGFPQQGNVKVELQTESEEDNIREKIKKMYHEIKTVKEENEIKLPECVYEFYDEEEVKMKRQLVEETKRLKKNTCKICGLVLEDPLCVLRHKRQEHKTEKILLSKEKIEPYLKYEERKVCPLCSKKIPKKGCKSEYIKHVMVHCDQYDFTCKVCGMKFRRKDHWQLHEARHVAPPPGV